MIAASRRSLGGGRAGGGCTRRDWPNGSRTVSGTLPDRSLPVRISRRGRGDASLRRADNQIPRSPATAQAEAGEAGRVVTTRRRRAIVLRDPSADRSRRLNPR
jgi:hypothetical protein